MTWNIKLANQAVKQFEKLAPDQRQLILTHLRKMRSDPFYGDVKTLKGKGWEGLYRKRVGRYRVIFSPIHSEHVVEIYQILPRTEKTYR